MIEYPIINGRHAKQCKCDNCHRVIYTQYEKHSLRKQLRSYYKSAQLYNDLNPESANVFDVWNGRDRVGVYCRTCIRDMNASGKTEGMETIHNVERCFYTEISEDKNIVDQIFDEDEVLYSTSSYHTILL